MNILLVANGKVNNKILSKDFIYQKNINKVIAVNGGSNKLIKLNILPDVIIGDLDSKKIKRTLKNETIFNDLLKRIIRFPKDKDYSDLDLGINYMINNVEDFLFQVYCFGAIGNRFDHTLANINSLFNLYIKKSMKNVIIYDTKSVLFLVNSNSEISLEVDVNLRVSVLAFNVPYSKVFLDGFKYQGQYDIPFLSSLGISNYTKNNIVKVKSIFGKLILILYSFNYKLL